MSDQPLSRAREFSDLPPYYLMLSFWGEKYRNYFYSLCLPSLLSPNNLPLLQHVRGSKLVISTTTEDWTVLRRTPLFQLLSTYVEPYFIDIGFPPPEVPIQLHMSEGHLRAARKAYEDRALAGFLAPDLVVSDGLLSTCISHAASGKKAVLAQALRFSMEPVLSTLSRHGFLKPDEPMTLPPRFLGALATEALHSEILRYDFESRYFADYPIWSYWRVNGRACLVMHTVSWALLLGSYEDMARYSDDFLHADTIDGFYVFRNFAHLRDTGEMHMITDSDEALLMSLTPEAEMNFPLRERPVNGLHRTGHRKRLVSVQRFLTADVVDPFRRWAYQIPSFIHGDDLDAESARTASKSVAITAAALALEVSPLPNRVPLPWLPEWGRRALISIADALIIPILGTLPRFYLRLTLRLVSPMLVRSIVRRLVHKGKGPACRRAPRSIADTLIIPILGTLPRFYLRLTLRLVPRPLVRSIVYRLAHRVRASS